MANATNRRRTRRAVKRKASAGAKTRRYTRARITEAGARTRKKKKSVTPTMVDKGAILKAKASKEMTVMKNPFLNTSTPRIPDGRSFYSTGMHWENVDTIDVPYDGQLHVFLYGGLDTYVTWFTTNVERSVESAGYFRTGFNEHRNTINPQGQPQDIVISASNAIAEWRNVSNGLHCMLLNNQDTDGMFWESVELKFERDPNHFTLQFENDPQANSGALWRFSRNWVADVIGLTNLPNDPSYMTGMNRTCYKNTFHTRPRGAVHDFIPQYERVTMPLNAFSQDDDIAFFGRTPISTAQSSNACWFAQAFS